MRATRCGAHTTARLHCVRRFYTSIPVGPVSQSGSPLTSFIYSLMANISSISGWPSLFRLASCRSISPLFLFNFINKSHLLFISTPVAICGTRVSNHFCVHIYMYVFFLLSFLISFRFVSCILLLLLSSRNCRVATTSEMCNPLSETDCVRLCVQCPYPFINS